MKKMLLSDLYRLRKKREIIFLLAFVLLEGVVSASIPCDVYTMLTKRINLNVLQIIELIYFFIIFVVDVYTKDLRILELLSGHPEKTIFLSRALISVFACFVISTMSVTVSVLIAAKLYGGTLDAAMFAPMILLTVKVLFIYACMMLISYTIRHQVYSFFVGTAVCFAVTKLSEYIIEPRMPLCFVIMMYLFISFLSIIFLKMYFNKFRSR